MSTIPQVTYLMRTQDSKGREIVRVIFTDIVAARTTHTSNYLRTTHETKITTSSTPLDIPCRPELADIMIIQITRRPGRKVIQDIKCFI